MIRDKIKKKKFIKNKNKINKNQIIKIKFFIKKNKRKLL